MAAPRKAFRITSYNVCYTKLLRVSWLADGTFGEPGVVLSFDEASDVLGSDVAVPAAGAGEHELVLAYGRVVRETATKETWSPRICLASPDEQIEFFIRAAQFDIV